MISRNAPSVKMDASSLPSIVSIFSRASIRLIGINLLACYIFRKFGLFSGSCAPEVIGYSASYVFSMLKNTRMINVTRKTGTEHDVTKEPQHWKVLEIPE